jgi:HlyD family secretion protein
MYLIWRLRSMPNWVRGLSVAVILLLIAWAAYYATYGSQQTAIGVRTSGIVEGPEVNLAPKAAGRILEICCNEGDSVQKDQVVIRLESDDLTAAVEQSKAGVERALANINVAESSVKYAQANIDTAEAEIWAVKADTDKARIQLDDSNTKLARLQALFQQNFISQEALDTSATAHAALVADYVSQKSKLAEAQYKRDASIAQLNTVKNQLQLARSDLKQAQAALAFNQAKLADMSIATPISGTVVFKALEKGETVSPGVTVLTVVDLANLYARVDVDESVVDKIAIGGDVTIRTEGTSGKQFNGKISEIGRYAEFATQKNVMNGRQDIKTFRVKIAFKEPAGILKPGMTVNVEIAKRTEK